MPALYKQEVARSSRAPPIVKGRFPSGASAKDEHRVRGGVARRRRVPPAPPRSARSSLTTRGARQTGAVQATGVLPRPYPAVLWAYVSSLGLRFGRRAGICAYRCPMRWALRDSATPDGGIAEVEKERAQECFVAGFGEPGHRGREFGQGSTGDSVAVRAGVVD